jgi:signal transduction histidine kinase
MGSDRSLSARIVEKPGLRYGCAILALLLASLISSALAPIAGDRAAYGALLAALAFCAWYCGPGPSTVAVALGVLQTLFGFIPRFHHFIPPTSGDWISLLVFVLSSLLVIVLGERRRRENATLIRVQGELEQRVQERTADLDLVNGNLRELSARLMQLQDDERRRIARELHDSVGQLLAALAMNLSTVRSDVERLTETAAMLSDSEALVKDMSAEVRTISHLLHPPLLDEAGLLSALRWYVEGFSQRSRIKVDLDLPDNFGRLPGEMETAIFRVVQECLTNIHRHSGSPVAKIKLRRHEDDVRVQIEDKGRGIPPEKQEEMTTSGKVGVGIRGMRERIRQLRGTLEVESNGSGTLIKVQLPVAEPRAEEHLSLPQPQSPAAA